MKTVSESRTVWLSIILAILAVVWPAAGKFISDNPEISAILSSVITILMRLITKEPVVFKR